MCSFQTDSLERLPQNTCVSADGPTHWIHSGPETSANESSSEAQWSVWCVWCHVKHMEHVSEEFSIRSSSCLFLQLRTGASVGHVFCVWCQLVVVGLTGNRIPLWKISCPFLALGGRFRDVRRYSKRTTPSACFDLNSFSQRTKNTAVVAFEIV